MHLVKIVGAACEMVLNLDQVQSYQVYRGKDDDGRGRILSERLTVHITWAHPFAEIERYTTFRDAEAEQLLSELERHLA